MFDRGPEFIPQSDEVVAYPKVLEFIRVNWWEFAMNGESDRRLGLTMAAVYADEIKEDIIICDGIARVSGINSPSHCSNPTRLKWDSWPKL